MEAFQLVDKKCFMSSIFTKIISGKIPSYKIFENDLIFAFLDISPIRPGHILIVPKVEIDYFVDVPENYYQAVFAAAKILTPAIQRSVDCQRIGMMVMGIDVPHFHLHLVPIVDGKEFSTPHNNPKPSQEVFLKLQKEIIEKLI